MRRPGRALTGVVLLGLLGGVAGCESVAPTTPVSAEPGAGVPAPPPEVRLLVFTDYMTGAQTSDVRDVHGQILRFNTAGAVIWLADGTEFAQFPMAYGYEKASVEVLWGSENGERRAYLTFSINYWHYPPPISLVDIEVVDGKLVIRHPDPPVLLPAS